MRYCCNDDVVAVDYGGAYIEDEVVDIGAADVKVNEKDKMKTQQYLGGY